MKITSPVFIDNGIIPSKYSCDGEDINPPLFFSEIPKEALSLVLVVFDQDAMGGDFVHWLVWNIRPETTEISENSVPEGASEGTTDFLRSGWGGPCPSSGTHRYQFHLYALNKMIDVPAGSDKTAVRKSLEGSIIEESSITGLYEKTD